MRRKTKEEGGAQVLEGFLPATLLTVVWPLTGPVKALRAEGCVSGLAVVDLQLCYVAHFIREQVECPTLASCETYHIESISAGGGFRKFV